MCAASAPEGNLVRHKKGTSAYFSVRIWQEGKRREHYISNKDSTTIAALAAKKYSASVLPYLKKNLAAAEAFLKTHSDLDEDAVASGLDPIILSKCGDIYITRELYAKEWLVQKWTERPYEDHPPQHPTLRGEMVRSKSEVFIANSLYRHDLIYHYEKPLYLSGSVYPIFPDFAILDIYTRTEIKWDHLGMIDDPDYAEKNTKKQRLYEQNGYILGKNLILTFETKNCPFTAVDAERTVRNFFLDRKTGLYLP